VIATAARRDSPELEIVPFEPDDLDEIMVIELASFSLPWSRKSYEELWPLGSIDIWVGRVVGEMVGYYLVQSIGEEMELHTFAVKPEFRRRGIGLALMEHMLANARDAGTRYILLQVRPSNDPARMLYGKLGFEDYAIRRNYYRDNGEDAFVMRLRLTA